MEDNLAQLVRLRDDLKSWHRSGSVPGVEPGTEDPADADRWRELYADVLDTVANEAARLKLDETPIEHLAAGDETAVGEAWILTSRVLRRLWPREEAEAEAATPAEPQRVLEDEATTPAEPQKVLEDEATTPAEPQKVPADKAAAATAPAAEPPAKAPAAILADSLEARIGQMGMALGETGNRVLQIALSDRSADDRMRDICDLDAACWAWSSPQWARLLKVSAPAVRQTHFWRVDRPEHFKSARDRYAEKYPDQEMPAELLMADRD